MKNTKELEKIFKACANYHRIDILLLLDRRPDISVFDIADEVKGDFRTVSEHLRKLTLGGLIVKRRKGLAVGHSITERGDRVLGFCRTLE